MTLLPETAEPKREKSSSHLFTNYYAAIMLFVIGGFLAASFFVLRPMVLGIKDVNMQTDSQLLRLAEQRKYLSSLDQSVSAAQSIDRASLDKVSHALPDQTDAPALLMQMSAAAARNSVQIGTIQFGDVQLPQPGPGGRVATSTGALPSDVSLSVHAQSYADVKRFLADVESSLRLLDVTGMTLGSVDASGAMTYQIQMRTYQFRPTQPTAALPQ